MSKSREGKIVAMFDQAVIGELIPQSAIQLLPLKPEPISVWNVRNLDLVQFIKYICDKDSYVVYTDGHKEKVNYKSYWETLYENSLTKFKDVATQFSMKANINKPVPASINSDVKILNFMTNKYFGSVAKYYSSYDAIVNGALSESYFFSIAHLLESQQELDCSIILAENLYYKQSLQVLRNFVELLTSQILFCWDSSEFSKWINGSFKLPRLRAKGGLLKQLSQSCQISISLSQRTALTYDSLNSFIHSSERNLIHRGQFKGQYKGYIFDRDYFQVWCKSFSAVVENGILLLNANFNQISKIHNEGLVCSVCHNNIDWLIEEEFEFAGTKYVHLKCKKCKNVVCVKKTN